MSTPEQPATPALTRKQMRDIRNTGATPIISSDVPASRTRRSPTRPRRPGARRGTRRGPEAVEAPAAVDAAPHVAPLPRAAVPAVVHDLPGADASVDLGVSPLTRRQARQQERIRTASVPVITPEVAAAHAASVAAAASAAAADGRRDPLGRAEPRAALRHRAAARSRRTMPRPTSTTRSSRRRSSSRIDARRDAADSAEPTRRRRSRRRADADDGATPHEAPGRPNTTVRMPQRTSAPSSTRSSARSCSPASVDQVELPAVVRPADLALGHRLRSAPATR